MRRFRSEKGAALLEAAITIPILLLISVGIFEFGRAYQTWQVLTNAAREGARVAVLEGVTDGDVRTRVNEYLNIGGLPSQPDGNIPINRSVPLTGTATAAQVGIDYPFEFMVLNPVVRLVVPGDTKTGAPITMHAQSTMRNE
jgi:Flp pilus assembly protein TadG